MTASNNDHDDHDRDDHDHDDHDTQHHYHDHTTTTIRRQPFRPLSSEFYMNSHVFFQKM